MMVMMAAMMLVIMMMATAMVMLPLMMAMMQVTYHALRIRESLRHFVCEEAVMHCPPVSPQSHDHDSYKETDLAYAALHRVLVQGAPR